MRVRVGAVARLLVFVVVLSATIVGTAAPTGAATVLDSSPRPGDVIAGPVPTIWLRFDESIRVTPDTFEVVDHNGIDACFTTQVNSTVVTLTFDEPLPAGRYRLVWAVGQSDSVRRGVLPFEVIVVDDGSEPPLEAADLRIPPSGSYAARNAGSISQTISNDGTTTTVSRS